jgi:hypothetical protein
MFQKYTDALAMMDQVIAAKNAVNAEHGEDCKWYWSENAAEIRKPITTAWDTLYTHLHSNFVCPQSVLKTNSVDTEIPREVYDVEIDEMVAMFSKDRSALEEELRKIPPVVAEVAFPVYVARHLLWTERMPISPDELTTFNEFHKRYGYMIIKSCDKRHK